MPLRRFGRPGLLGAVARTAVIAGTASATANAVGRWQNQRAADQQDAQAYRTEQQAPAPAALPGGAGDDLVSRLDRLAGLRDSGALSAEEFEAAKAKLLAS